MTAVMLVPLAVLRLLVLGEVVPLETFLEIDDPLMILAMAAYLLYKQSATDLAGNRQLPRHNAAEALRLRLPSVGS